MSTSTIPKKVLLKGNPYPKEGKAGGAIKPGHLIDFDNNGDLVVHATAGGPASPYFADCQDFIGGGLDKDYADDDNVKYLVAERGNEIYAFLKAGENVAKGDRLMSAGDGSLKKFVAQAINEGGAANVTINPDVVVARALEALNNAGGTNLRIKVEVK